MESGISEQKNEISVRHLFIEVVVESHCSLCFPIICDFGGFVMRRTRQTEQFRRTDNRDIDGPGVSIRVVFGYALHIGWILTLFLFLF